MSDQQQCCFRDLVTGKRCENPVVPQAGMLSCDEHLAEIEYWRHYYRSMLYENDKKEVQ